MSWGKVIYCAVKKPFEIIRNNSSKWCDPIHLGMMLLKWFFVDNFSGLFICSDDHNFNLVFLFKKFTETLFAIAKSFSEFALIFHRIEEIEEMNVKGSKLSQTKSSSVQERTIWKNCAAIKIPHFAKKFKIEERVNIAHQQTNVKTMIIDGIEE